MSLENVYSSVYSDLPAVNDISSAQKVTYDEIKCRAESLQSKLRAVGVQPGHRVLVAYSKDVDWITSFLALTSLEAVLVPVPAYTRKIEIDDIFENYRIDGVLADYDFIMNNNEAFDASFSLQYLITPLTKTGNLPVSLLPVFYDLSSMESSSLSLKRPTDDQVLTCHFTYKGLGHALAVEHTYNDYACAVKSCQDFFAFKTQHKVLVLLPSFPVFGLVTNLLFPLSYGAQLFVRTSKRKNISSLIREHQVAHVNIVPPLIDLMISEAQKYGEYDFSSTCFVSGGSYLSRDKVKIFESLFKTAPVQGYGLTETLPVFTNHPKENTPGSLGKVMRKNISVKIADSKGKRLPAGKTGEICLKGQGVCTRYANIETPLPQVFRDGWLRTGDLGYVDEEGRLYFKGRRLAFCKILGHMVDLKMIEDLALTLTFVTRARCYTIREYGRKKLCLALCVKRGFSMSNHEISRFFKERLSAPKCPSLFKVYTVSFHQMNSQESMK